MDKIPKNLITIVGLQKLHKLKKVGKELPEGWQESVKFYINSIHNNLVNIRNEYREEKSKYKLAKAIADDLGV